MTKRFWLGILFCLKTFIVFSQIQITYPVSRIVFQRDNNNQALITVAGNYFQNLDRVEARMIPVWNGSGNETSWVTIANFPTTGFFNGQIMVSGGWYNLEVRGILNGNVVTNTTLDRVGIGEVFIVAGQSNAQGDAVYSGGGTGTNDDRVSCIDYYESFLNEDNLPFQFSQMGNFKRMAPYNYVPWFWGRLGEKLVQRLNVPVLFYGAALGGIGSSPWRRSALGTDLRSELPLFIAVAGMPYRGLKAALQHYSSRTGVRAILWQQGESDAQTPQALYYDNMLQVINKSRQDAQKGDLAWVVARSSANPEIHTNVIEAQNQLIRSINNVYEGPNTDQIVGPENRKDGVHFHNDGLVKAADAWASYLDNGFFNNSNPLRPSSLLNISLSCNRSGSNISYNLNITNGGLNNHIWNTGQRSTGINVSNGTFTAKAQDGAGNMYFSQPINVSTNQTNNQPNISVSGNTTFCEGGTVQLTSSIAGGNLWSNGERSQTIFVRNSGNYTLQNFSLNGCSNASNNSVPVNVIPGPPNSIISNKPTTICPDDSLILGSTNSNNVTYRWNTNQTSQTILVRNAGTYDVSVRDRNTGCENKQFITVEVRNRPQASIVADSPTTFCFGGNVNLSANRDFNEYIWSTGNKTKNVNIKLNGEYTLRVKDQFGCLSETLRQRVVVHPLPTAKISSTGLEQFCEGNSVKLSSSIETNSYQWNTGENSKEINRNRPGLITLQVRDNNGCFSVRDSLDLKYIPSPIAEITGENGLNTFCEGNTIALTSKPAAKYTWNTGQADQKVNVSKAGIYTLTITDDKNCKSKPTSFEVFSKPKPPIPSILFSGTYELTAITSPEQLDYFYEWKLDNNTLKSTLKTTKTPNRGDYSVKAGINYSLGNNQSLTCLSDFSKSFYYNLPENDTGVSAYPNPNPDGKFFIETREEVSNALIDIFSRNGHLIYSTSISDLTRKRTLDLSNLGSGIYIMKLSGSNFKGSKNIILQ